MNGDPSIVAGRAAATGGGPTGHGRPIETAARRRFLGAAGGTVGALLAAPLAVAHRARRPAAPPFRISLAEWSLHRALHGGELDHLDFPRAAKRDYGIDAVEYVSSFFADRRADPKHVRELRRRCDAEGVRSLLVMVDGEGRLGDPDPAARRTAVDNHRKWLDAAAMLGGHSIRVNAASEGTREEQLGRVADGLHDLCELGAAHGLSVIVENHGGLSSDGSWLAAVMREVGHPACGTLPDFGNFHLGGGRHYDRYLGVEELMPFARAVSAKSHDFAEDGSELHTDYLRMLRIVLEAGYRGFVGIEYEGSGLPEPEGIRRTKALLESVRDRLAADFAGDGRGDTVPAG